MNAALLPRDLHPAAWWLWALGLAAAASATTNPLLLALILAVACLVVVARRGSSPWARAFRFYLWLGLAIVAVRVVLHVLVGLKTGDVVVLPLPEIRLPAWAAGVEVLGDVRLDGLVLAVVLAARLAVLVACVGAANALANPKRLLRALPGALHEVGAAVVVSVTVAPQLAESVQRVVRARRLRGDSSRGLRAVRRVAMPVLEDTLDRSLLLASAMDSRGYGHRDPGTVAARTVTGAVTLAGLVGAAVGTYGLLDTTSPAWLGVPVLLVGLALAVLGLWLGGRGVRHTSHRPDPWRWPEWLTAVTGPAAGAAVLLTGRLDPGAVVMPVPLAAPELPPLTVVVLLVAAAPAFLTPEPPVARAPRLGRRARAAEDTVAA